MRTIAVLLCLLPSVANAYEVRAVFGLGTGGAEMYPSPQDAVFRVGPVGGPAILEWTLEDLTPADSGHIFSIDENTAPFDWSLLEAAVGDPTGLRFESNFTFNWAPTWPNNIVMHRVDHVDFNLREFFVSPIGSVAVWQHEVVGDGYQIPEPSSAMLVIMASLLPWRSYRRSDSCETRFR